MGILCESMYERVLKVEIFWMNYQTILILDLAFISLPADVLWGLFLFVTHSFIRDKQKQTPQDVCGEATKAFIWNKKFIVCNASQEMCLIFVHNVLTICLLIG